MNEDRFWSKVDKTESCWLWKASKHRNGYAQFGVGNDKIVAHRYVWLITHGQIPAGKEINHICNVRHCVNPAHLELLTHAENMTYYSVSRTHCKNGHLLEGDNLKMTKLGRKRCVTCNRIYQKKADMRRRAKA